ncbi:ABC transporter ATP-binding protein [Microbacterium trichothecenolyticum]|uniref:ABC-2 type transport system ATP-binding protein n=1 Tax=Microbacterium trichothecenolyticum TaxID=69370 RepID=A0ABU0TSZ9_MICTR|nr:ABC transporter ATP-binding protein [Microbacterium trichothecenolyticum]MDQ1122089.1 ABC-2 type transport system ATP-binding protein [Microbacterium trichothecenolyticum]
MDRVDSAIVVEQARCAYDDFVAVDDVSFTVRQGDVHALLGTNGAGKTTLLENIQGFRQPADGTIRVFGRDPWRNRTTLAARTGTMLQESCLVDEMTVARQLSLWRSISVREDSTDRVLEIVGLTHRRKVPVAVLSGGERRRLDFAMAIWGSPELLILDEPTTGLDPQSRRAMWEIIGDLHAKGSTVLLTTHYLDEAQSLADHVTILDRGKVAVAGSLADVLDSIPARISFTCHAAVGELAGLRTRLHGALDAAGDASMSSVEIRTGALQEDVSTVMDWARAQSLSLGSFRCSPASLEDVFFTMPTAAASRGATRPEMTTGGAR